MTRLSDTIAPGELLRGWTASDVPEEFARPHKGSRKPDCLTHDLLRVMREMENRGLECIGHRMPASCGRYDGEALCNRINAVAARYGFAIRARRLDGRIYMLREGEGRTDGSQDRADARER
jgi:hypothetical protein